MWIDIIGWEEFYEVNENGDVRNKKTKNILIGDKNSIGYPRVCLYNVKNVPVKQRFFRHRLVASHFLDNINNYEEVNHIDSNIENSNYKNLEWCDKKYNELHSRKNPNSKKEYKPFDVIFDNGEILTFNSKYDLANMLHVSHTLVKLWLHEKSETYKKYKIVEIKYSNK